MTPGRCFFAFSNPTTVRIRCTSDMSNSSAIPSTLLSSSYFTSVTRVEFGRTISTLPNYICPLPSRSIDLSFQSFTTLSDATFPCLDSFRIVNFAFNSLTSVNIVNSNFSSLTSLDLSSNQLNTLPYSIINRTPNSLRFLNLRNNSITSIDLFLYTLKNITIDLRDNPINTSSIINPFNISLSTINTTNPSVNITLPLTLSSGVYLFNDQTALTAGACNRYTVLALRNTLQLTSNVQLDCSCASINLKEIFLRNRSNIIDDFTCVNGTNTTVLNALTMTSCQATAVNFTTGLCYNESLQVCTAFFFRDVRRKKIDRTISHLKNSTKKILL